MKDDKQYTEHGFWEKITTIAKKAGQEVMEKALQLHYTAEAKETPRWVKVTIYGALAYLIAPLDMIPDFLPGGLVDDMGILAGHYQPLLPISRPK